MQQLNRYYWRSKISERKMRQIIKYFALALTASKTAQIVALTRPSVSRIFVKIRNRISEEAERASPFSGTVKVDESYFGARRVRGKRGRGASGKQIVLGIFKRSGSVYTELVPNCKAQALQAIIRGHAAPETIIHSDGWRGYDGLVDVGYSKHFRVDHGDNQFADGTNYINGIESFRSFAKRRLQKFNGVSPQTFYLHLKECEYRFNDRKQNLFRLLLKLLEKYPL
jgi:transposase